MGGRRTATTFVVAAGLLAAVSARASTGHEQDVADALQSSPVYVAPARAHVLDAGAVGRLQLLIARNDIGRIKIAVVPRAWAQQSGGVGRFTSGVDGALDLRGTLVVVAEDAHHYDVHASTSHTHVDEVVAGLQHSFDQGGTLEQRLARSAHALANADPGPSGDTATEDNTPANSTPTITVPHLPFPDPNRIVSSVGHTIEFTVILIIVLTLLPFIAIGVWFAVRARRGRHEDREVFSDDLASVDQERTALGEDIVDLDTATSGADVPPAARAAYEKALDAYDRSDLLVKQCDSQRRLVAVKKLVADGRQAAAKARAATGPNLPAG